MSYSKKCGTTKAGSIPNPDFDQYFPLSGTALSIGDNSLPMGVALKISQVAVEAK
jgi:hypothetical protein